MAAVLFVAAFSTSFACWLAVHGWTAAVVPADESAKTTITAWVALIVVSLLVVFAAAVWIYRLDAGYLRPGAVWRWLVMGVLLGILLFAISILLPHRQPGDSAMLSTWRTMGRWLLSPVALYLSHWLAFKAPFWAAGTPHRDIREELPSATEGEHQA